jgi:hypothetical protein
MAVALVLAYKFNEPITSTFHEKLHELLDQIDENWEVSRKEVFEAEFGVYVQLGFSLHAPHQVIYLFSCVIFTIKLLTIVFTKYIY